MKSLHELTEPISYGTLQDLQKSSFEPLKNLQGNILQGHGRDRSVHIFLTFKCGMQKAVKDWIKKLAQSGEITSANKQFEEIKQYRIDRTLGDLFMSLFLSAKGYRYLYPKTKGQLLFDDAAFLSGMQAAQDRLNDPPVQIWELGYQKKIHAMILLADDDESRLEKKKDELCQAIESLAEICPVETGKVMWDRRNYPQQYPVEHFGFVDGRSQPLFFQSDIERETLERGGTDVWDPGAGPALVLAPDPYGVVKDGNRVVYQYSGSYLVFRKLEQFVRAFKEREQQLAQALGLKEDGEKRAGALVMGRFEDGTPIVLKSAPDQSTPVLNNFTYDKSDPDGRKCPFQAHTRKVNPRQEGTPHVVRRGITYGDRAKEPQDNPSPAELPVNGVGLLFMCYQRNIAQQFELLQYFFAGDPRNPGEGDPGIDPVIGQLGANGVGSQNWPANWNDSRDRHKPFEFHGYVMLKGGEYFFAPSIYFLRNIDQEIR
jgi:Dyp-type peroxidase family